MAWTAATRGDYVRPSGSYASDVTDREWALIAPLLPAVRPGGRPRTTCLRRVLDAIFYLLQTGCQWRMLPRDFPPRSTVYGYFRAWIATGVWAHVHDVLYRRTRELEGRDESPTAAIIDSQSVKTGAEAREMVGYDAGKRIKGRKRHLVTDTLGLVLRIEVHSASVQDRDGAALILDRITRRFPFLERIFADAGYQGPRVAAAAPRPVEIIKRTDAGFVVQPKRWVIERTFAWACINRRLARDVERAVETVRALFQIAMIKLMTGSHATGTFESDSKHRVALFDAWLALLSRAAHCRTATRALRRYDSKRSDMTSPDDSKDLAYDVIYRATAAEGEQVEVRLRTTFAAATIADAWGRLTALYDGVDPMTIEIELRESAVRREIAPSEGTSMIEQALREAGRSAAERSRCR